MILADDPMLAGHLDWGVVAIVAVKAAVTLGITLVATMLMIWFERKVISDLQNRIGPNRAGPFGILQTLADGLKVLLKEDLIPDQADKWVFRLAPIFTMVPAFIVFGLIPLGGDFRDGNAGMVHIFGHDTTLQLADPGAGVLVILCLHRRLRRDARRLVLRSKYPFGSVRASSRWFLRGGSASVLAVVLCRHALGQRHVAPEQLGWNLWVTGPSVRSLRRHRRAEPPPSTSSSRAETGRLFQTEYSGFRFAIFYLAEFNTSSPLAIIVTFLAGPTDRCRWARLALGLRVSS